MADFYPYLIASLPMLHFGMKPPFSFERFIEWCSSGTPEKDLQIICNLPKPEEYHEPKEIHQVISRWIEFDTDLRNELVRIRSAKRNTEPAAFLRPGSQNSRMSSDVMAVTKISLSPRDSEEMLDTLRWKKLDELATNHHFDLTNLITYAYQLQILLRWERIHQADGSLLLNEIVTPPVGS